MNYIHRKGKGIFIFPVILFIIETLHEINQCKKLRMIDAIQAEIEIVWNYNHHNN